MTFPGNGEVIQQIFNAVANISGSSWMGGAAQAAALLGFLVMIAVAAFKLDMRESFSSIFVISIIWMGFMTPKSDLLITESAGYGFSGKQYAVSNVPFGIAATASIISQFGVLASKNMERVYSTPDALAYSSSGMLFGNRTYEHIYNSRINDNTLKEDWALFIHNCSFYDINLYNLYSLDDLRNTDNMLTLMGNTNNALFTNIAIRNGQKITRVTKSCKEAYASLKIESQKELQKSFKQFAAKAIPNLGTTNPINQEQAVLNMSNTSMQFLLNNTRIDTKRMIEQSAMNNLISDTSYINNQRNQNAAAIQKALSTSMARSQYLTAQQTSGAMAAWNLPIYRSLLECILIGIFPMVVVIALLAGMSAFQSLAFYFMGLMWLQLWSVIASIYNFVMTIYSKKQMAAELAMSMRVDMINGESSWSIYQAAVDAQATAGGAYWLIPTIAGALAWGGKGLMQSFMSGVTAGKSNAESAGAQVGAGNYNYGNLNTNNASANKTSMNSVYQASSMSEVQSVAGTTWTDNSSGENRIQARNDSFSVSGNSSASSVASYMKQASESEAQGMQQQAIASQTYSAGTASTWQYASQSAINSSQNNGYNLGLSQSNTTGFQKVNQSASQVTQGLGQSNSTEVKSAVASRIGLGLSADVSTQDIQKADQAVFSAMDKANGGKSSKSSSSNGKFGADLGGGWSGSSANTHAYQSAINKAISSLSTEGVRFDNSFNEQITQSAAFSKSLSSGDSLAHSANSSFGQSNQAVYSAQESFTRAKEAREMASQASSSSSSVSIDNSRAVKGAMEQKGSTLSDVYNNPTAYIPNAAAATSYTTSEMQNELQGTEYSTKQGNVHVGDTPSNNVAGAHSRNAAVVQSGVAGNDSYVQGIASANGINPSSINNQIATGMQDAAQQYQSMRQDGASGIQGTESSIQKNVDTIQRRSDQQNNYMDSGASGLAANVGSAKPITFSDKKDAELYGKVADGTDPYSGAGIDQTRAHMQQGSNLTDSQRGSITNKNNGKIHINVPKD